MSLEHILISYEEYERLKTIEKQFEEHQKQRTGNFSFSNRAFLSPLH